MPVTFSARCPCAYQSPRLKIGPNRSPLVCLGCKGMVIASRHRYRHDYEPCKACDSHLSEANDCGEGWLITGRPSWILCPQCQANPLTFEIHGHIDYRTLDHLPELGEIVHLERACVGGKIRVPDLNLGRADIVLEGLPEGSTGRFAAVVNDIAAVPSDVTRDALVVTRFVATILESLPPRPACWGDRLREG